MKYDEFKSVLVEEMEKIKVILNEDQCMEFYNFMQLLLEWNEKVNLTAITDSRGIILKHFVDSVTIGHLLDGKYDIIDVGTGAGFPGIPLAIYNKNLEITLLDSLNKRINFLEEVKRNIKLDNIINVHGRAEDLGRDKFYREQFDVAVSRAVAPLNILLEYLLPFVKVGGICICMKGPNANEEIDNSKNALNRLNGKIEYVKNITIDGVMDRNIIVVKKTGKIPEIYPRKAGTPSKKPL